MSDEHNDCGHTEEEHAAQLQNIVKEVSRGNFAPLMPQASHEGLMETLQAGAIEIFIRAESLNEARAIWDNLDGLVRDTFRGDNAEDSKHPEEFTHVMEARDQYQARIEQTVFEEEALDGLDELFRNNGTLDDDPPAGFYL